MAEGDTIHRLARRLRVALAGPLDSATAPAPDSPLRRQSRRLELLAGTRIEAARAHGKHLLVHFDGGLVLHSHLGMSGRWEVAVPRARWRRPARAARLLLAAGGEEAAQFGGTILALRTESELRANRRLASLGPDILADDLSVVEAAASVRRDRSQTVGEALLDQSRIAGIGNIFKSESCFAAEVDPWRRLAEVDGEELARVVAAARELMSAAVESGRQPRRVYRRAGRPCPRCGTPIRSRGQGDANRTTYWCPGCQR